ncbi:hypothetical protein QYE76_032828 [Lolium multiflorum]|uniref:Arabidopsis retrotransposon Orf1 C-terminal domain-containing protein n=1 Tax=Lolium multiflorum TaxID=4521 RepID=A0AAD8VLI7_LOLMU|nr:hypothetical protein QYE76_032828 [Lolium multiflorum]
MGKPRDTKVAILPSTTRKGTTLSTSAALDSPSVISQLVSPPQTSRVGTSAESENSSDNFDDASTVLDNAGSLGPFLDATIEEKNSDEAEELLAKISKNHDDWSTPEPTPTPILKKRGMIELNDEDMREAKKSLMEKGIKSEDVKNLPPIEDLCKIIPPSSTIEVHSLQRFDRGDIPYSKPPDQCLDEFDNYIVKQNNFNMRVENHLMENSQAIGKLHDIVERTSNDVKMLVKHFNMIQTQIDQLTKVQNDLLKNNHEEKQVYEVTTRGGVSTQDPLYPEGHPKRIEQDSQRTKEISSPSKKKKKKHKTVVESSEPVNDPNSISISDAETESGNEHEEDNNKNDTPDKEEIEKEPEKHDKNKKYTKEDFITKKHGAVIDCNKGKVTFNVDDKEHTVYFPKRIDKRRKMNNYNFGEVFEGETTSTGRPSRASTRIRRSYNEDVIAPSFDEGNGDPNASSFPCYEFLSNAGLLDDFLTLIGKAGLTTYMEDERKQYYMLTKIFVESFKFNNKQFSPTVAFKIYGNPVTMKLKDFCAALGIAPAGTARKIEDNPRVLLELYREITNDDCRTIQRGKIRNIQLPAIKYFAYYLATSILGRENTSNISSYHLAFLIAALTGETPYHLGSVIARRLSNKGPIYGGIIASRILARLDLPLDPNDVEIPPVKLDIAAMKSHQFVTIDSSMDNIVYRMLFADGDEREVLLPQTDLFSIDRKPWSRSKEEVDEQLKIQGFHQQHDSEDAEPSYDYTVTYPVASSSTYLEPGRSSSYYGDTTSWGPWE